MWPVNPAIKSYQPCSSTPTPPISTIMYSQPTMIISILFKCDWLVSTRIFIFQFILLVGIVYALVLKAGCLFTRGIVGGLRGVAGADWKWCFGACQGEIRGGRAERRGCSGRLLGSWVLRSLGRGPLSGGALIIAYLLTLI